MNRPAVYAALARRARDLWDPMCAVVNDDENVMDSCIDEALTQPTLTAEGRAWLLDMRALSEDERWEVMEIAWP